jgi:hypothetical protein
VIFSQWLPVVALVAFLISDLFRSDTPPSWLSLSKQERLAIAGVLAVVACTILAHVQQGLPWPVAVMNGLGSAGLAWAGIHFTAAQTAALSTLAGGVSQALPAIGEGDVMNSLAAVKSLLGSGPLTVNLVHSNAPTKDLPVPKEEVPAAAPPVAPLDKSKRA